VSLTQAKKRQIRLKLAVLNRLKLNSLSILLSHIGQGVKAPNSDYLLCAKWVCASLSGNKTGLANILHVLLFILNV